MGQSPEEPKARQGQLLRGREVIRAFSNFKGLEAKIGVQSCHVSWKKGVAEIWPQQFSPGGVWQIHKIHSARGWKAKQKAAKQTNQKINKGIWGSIVVLRKGEALGFPQWPLKGNYLEGDTWTMARQVWQVLQTHLQLAPSLARLGPPAYSIACQRTEWIVLETICILPYSDIPFSYFDVSNRH